MNMKNKIILLFAGELITFSITVMCFSLTYSFYWGDFLKGGFAGGLIFVFFGWTPALIGILRIPLNIVFLQL